MQEQITCIMRELYKAMNIQDITLVAWKLSSEQARIVLWLTLSPLGFEWSNMHMQTKKLREIFTLRISQS